MFISENPWTIDQEYEGTTALKYAQALHPLRLFLAAALGCFSL